MAHPSRNKVPTVLLSCSSNPDRNVLVPPNYVTKHRKLITLARHKCGQDYPPEQFDLHFHHTCVNIFANEDRCDAELDDFLYDEGDYFVLPYVQQKKLRLYPHFVMKNDSSKQGEGTVGSANGIKNEGSAMAYEETAVDDNPRLRRDESAVSRSTQLFVPEQHYEDDSTCHYEEPRETTAEPGQSHGADATHVGQGVRHRENQRDQAQATALSSSRPSTQIVRTKMMSAGYTALSKEATGKKWADDLASLENASTGTPKRDRTRNSAHATLIDGALFGVEVKDPCQCCITHGRNGRIYNPQLLHDTWSRTVPKTDKNYKNRRSRGVRCSECRRDGHGPCGAA